MINIHPLADVQSANIGDGTSIWQFAIVLSKAVIGKNCNINCHTFIENDVVIGDRVTVKAGVQIWDGVRVDDDVFIGPNVTFTNDKQPRSKQYPQEFFQTVLKQGASVGANATILPGLTIGKYSLIGAGSVVTTNVPDHAIVYGNPAIVHGWVDEQGKKLNSIAGDLWISEDGIQYIKTNTGLQRK